MKSPVATPEKKKTGAIVQEESWKFITATLKEWLKRLLENLLEGEANGKVNPGCCISSQLHERYFPKVTSFEAFIDYFAVHQIY